MEAISTTHDPIFAGGSTIAQNALAQALDKHDDELTAYVDDLRELCRTNASTMLEAFAKIEMVGEMPAATYYLLLRHNRASDMEAFEELLKLGLVATPGSAFFSDQSVNTGFIRIHAGISTESRQRVVAAVHG
jgi:aspartate/methionine/tyrosine aminotransferase